MDEIEALADNITIMNNGQAEIQEKTSQYLCTEFSGPKIYLDNNNIGSDVAKFVSLNNELTFRKEIKTSELLALLEFHNIRDFICEERDFSDIFLEMYDRIMIASSANE